jgi:hypothetical protein
MVGGDDVAPEHSARGWRLIPRLWGRVRPTSGHDVQRGARRLGRGDQHDQRYDHTGNEQCSGGSVVRHLGRRLREDHGKIKHGEVA